MIDPNCTCEVAGTDGRWYIDIDGNYRCAACEGILNEQDESNVE